MFDQGLAPYPEYSVKLGDQTTGERFIPIARCGLCGDAPLLLSAKADKRLKKKTDVWERFEATGFWKHCDHYAERPLAIWITRGAVEGSSLISLFNAAAAIAPRRAGSRSVQSSSIETGALKR